MNISRRGFLQILAAAGVALSLPNTEQVLAETAPQLPVVNPEILGNGLRTCTVTLSDGTRFEIRGYVTSQLVNTPIDGISTSDITFKPTGEVRVTQGRRPRFQPGQHVALQLDGEEVLNVQDIALPQMRREMIDVTRDPCFTGEPEKPEYVLGLKRYSDLTFNCAFDGEILL